MKNNFFVYIIITAFMAGAVLMSCGKTSEQKVKNAKEDIGKAEQELKETQAGYLAEWQTFKSEYDSTIEANIKRIDAFKEKMDNAGPEVKAKHNKEVAVLEQKNNDLKMKLAEYKDDGQIKWEEFKTNFKKDIDGIGKTMDDLFKDNT